MLWLYVQYGQTMATISIAVLVIHAVICSCHCPSFCLSYARYRTLRRPDVKQRGYVPFLLCSWGVNLYNVSAVPEGLVGLRKIWRTSFYSACLIGPMPSKRVCRAVGPPRSANNL